MSSYRVQVEVCSVVVGDNDIERVRAYLYDHTTVGDSDYCTVKQLSYYVLTTTVFDFVTDEDLRDARSTGSHVLDRLITEAKRLAKYQCDRLASGLYGTYAAEGDYDNCQEKISELAYG